MMCSLANDRGVAVPLSGMCCGSTRSSGIACAVLSFAFMVTGAVRRGTLLVARSPEAFRTGGSVGESAVPETKQPP